MNIALLATFLVALSAAISTTSAALELQDYVRHGELAPLPAGTASLYRTPWRSNPRTAAAIDARNGIGVYWKHIPASWTEHEQTNVMRQMFQAGVRRLRIATHLALYLTGKASALAASEVEALRRALRAAKAADLRPCVTFVHVPPIGRAGINDPQDWLGWVKLMPAGDVGSPQFNAYLDETYEALRRVLDEARAAGFIDPGSYDLEMGQNLWWGGPAAPRPLPHTSVADLKPNGRIYEFDRALIMRLRQQGYREPLVWWSQVHHHVEDIANSDLPDTSVGWAFSLYDAWTGNTASSWLSGQPFDSVLQRGPNDIWPMRAPLRFAEGTAPAITLARPESYMADRTRHDNLIELLRRVTRPVAITALGAVPAGIPGAPTGGLTGWQIKQRALTRALAFWLNQGAQFVLLHSAYDADSGEDGAGSWSLLPTSIDPATFTLDQAPPLVTLRHFSEALRDAQPITRPAALHLRFTLEEDPVLIPATGAAGPLKASDALVLLPFQLDDRSFAIAAYVMTPNIARPMPPLHITLQLDRELVGAPETIRPTTLQTGAATIVDREPESTTVRFALYDDVVWLRIGVR